MSQSTQLIPEYFPVASILLALPFAGGDWSETLDDVLCAYRNMVESFVREDSNIKLLLLAKSGRATNDWLQSLNIRPEQYERISIITNVDYNDTWIRDYGPLCLRAWDEEQNARLEYHAFHFNGWGNKYASAADNKVPSSLAQQGLTPLYNHQLVLEGGAVEINAQGTMLLNRDCIVDKARNPGLSELQIKAVLVNQLGVKCIEWVEEVGLTGDDTDGHIDTLARFVDDQTVVCCGRSAMHHDAAALERLNTQLERICKRRSWRLLYLPMPVVRSKVDGRILPATYANFLVCNGVVYLPAYNVSEDAQAIKVLSVLAPTFRVVPVRCEALLEQHGSLHCATMQLSL